MGTEYLSIMLIYFESCIVLGNQLKSEIRLPKLLKLGSLP